MKIIVEQRGQKDGQEDDPQSTAGWPKVDEPLGSPASLEVQFFNLATVPDGEGYKDNPALETEVESVGKTVELTKGVYSSRKQTENMIYRKNAYLLSEQAIIDEFGPDNPDRFDREPLLPILVDDPDTNPPNNMDVDNMLRRDGIGVNTPIFHIELLKDSNPISSRYYKKGKILRGINVDLKRGMRVYPAQYGYTKKYNEAKQHKTKEPLTFIIDNIWETKANLSIEEIESASHFITSVVSADENTDPLGMGYSIDSVEGIFYNKFDTYLAKDRKIGETFAFPARYKVTTEPMYSAEAHKQSILQFTAGGTLRIKVFMMPRNWLYYSRFYTTTVCNENGGGLEDLIYTWWTWSNWPNTPKEWSPTYYHYPALIRNEIVNTTKLFALWGKPPHDYRLPRRDDESIQDLYKHMDTSFTSGFCHFDGEEDPGYWGYDPYTHEFIQGRYTYAEPGAPWVSLPEQCWESPQIFLHDVATSDNLYNTGTTDVRDFSNRGFATYPEEAGDKFFDNSKYGWLRGAMRGLFLYSFPSVGWIGSPDDEGDVFTFSSTSHAMNKNSPAEHRNSHYPKNFGGHVFWHKTPDGIVPHWYTRPWINHAVGLWHGQGHSYRFWSNYEYYQTPSMVITPPDGGVMKFDTTTSPITCREYAHEEGTGDQQIYRGLHEDYSPNWNECDRKAYDGSIYDEDEVAAFLKLWERLRDFQIIQDEVDFESEYIDNVPYMLGVAGAGEGSLLAMIKVEGGKTFYIWRVIDEEEGEAPIPLMPIAGGTTYYETQYDFYGNPFFIHFYWPLFNCGEVWNQWSQTGNIKTAYDTTTLTDYNAPFIYYVPGLGRIATHIVHQYVTWPNGTLDTLFDDRNPWPPGSGYSTPSGYPRSTPTLTQPYVHTEDIFELEMPVYLMTYREKALRDEGSGATRWCGSFMKAGGNICCTSQEHVADGSDDGNTWEVTAALRDRDMC